jgi:TP901 family phage tail tape measure protein
VLSSMKSSAQRTLDDITALGAKVDLFPKLGDQVKGASDALQKARDDVAALTTAIAAAKAAGSPTAELEKGLKSAQTQLAATTREFNNGVTALSKLENSLTRAGVDTSNLAGEQSRLAAAQVAASNAATQASAKQALGLKTLADIQPQINQAYAAYNTLIASGTLSTKEQAIAQAQLNTQVAALRGQITGVGTAAKAGGIDLLNLFQRSILPALGVTASIGGVIHALGSAIDAAKQYNQGVAEIGSVTNLTKEQLAALGQGARDLARDLGLDLNQTLKALFDLIRSGISPDNALEVLKLAAEASKASLADLGSGVKAAQILIRGFGVDVKDLGPALNLIVQGAKDGGLTLAQFAESAGPLISVAKAAHIPLDELVATLTVMANKTGDAEKATSDLTRIIAKLDTSAAREKLRELGIEGTGLVDIFQKIGAKGLSLDQILALGIGSTKSAAGISALTSSAGGLQIELDKLRNSSGATAKALADLYDTPKERAARFDASFHESVVQAGLLAGAQSRLAVAATGALNVFNAVPTSLREAGVATGGFTSVIGATYQALFRLMGGTDAAKKGIDALGAAADGNRDQIDRLLESATKASADLKDFGAKLEADITAIHAAATRDIADATTRADAQIAALDKSAKAEIATAKATLEIRTKLAADSLAIIVGAEANVTQVVNEAIAARIDAARKAGDSEAKIAADNAQLRINALAPVLAQYQKHYSDLVKEEQAYSAKIQSIEQERVGFNQGVEDKIRAIRNQTLSQFDQYYDKVSHVDELISKARTAFADGDLAMAKKYTTEAITLADTIKGSVVQDGVTVVSTFESQYTSINKLKEAGKLYNQILDAQKDSAKAGADATRKALADVSVDLARVQREYDELKKTVAEGLNVKVNVDETSVASALAALNALTRDRAVTVTVNYRTPDGAQAPAPTPAAGGDYVPPVLPPPGLNAGGRVDLPNVRGFAVGGPIFPAPTWAKVPGAGNADTVPAALQGGSFVMRKAAVGHYGDGTMTHLARGFASGGAVPPPLYTFGGAGVTPNPANSPYFGSMGSGTVREGGPLGSAPTLPSDPKQKIITIFRYVDAVKTAALVDDYFYWQNSLDQLTRSIAVYQRSPTDPTTLDQVLSNARFIGLNIGVSKGDLAGFDVDGRAFHKEFGSGGTGFGGLQRTPGTFVYDFYAKGGPAGSDTVPAFLTPGEYVIKPAAVDAISHKFGGGFLDAVNQMRLAPGALASLIDPPAPARHYAQGGAVSYSNVSAAASAASAPASSRASLAQPPAQISIPITIHTTQRVDKELFQREVMPLLEQAMRRSGSNR